MISFPAFLPIHQLLKKTSTDWASYWGFREQEPLHDYLGYIATLVDHLIQLKAKRVFVINKDRAYFLAGFLAALHANLPVILPPLEAADFLKELMQSGDCIVTDQLEIAAIAPLAIIADKITITKDQDPKFTPLNPASAHVVFYTSGSTGSPKQVEKYLLQIEAEVATLQKLWGGAKGCFVSTVSHQHIYGLLFSLLWPVCGGYPVKRSTCLFWEDLLSQCDSHSCIISSPSHLGRFPILSSKIAAVNQVFSSGGVLPTAAAQATRELLGVLPTEIYGSTESGGIAYRQQLTATTPWTRFETIEIKVDEEHLLHIRSPYLENADWYQMADRISLINKDQFHLLGRADRIVKVEGKRVSLSSLEHRLLTLEAIQEAAVLLLKNTAREELGAMIVLSAKGKQILLSDGKVALIRKLRQNLSSYFDRVAIPRKWRFVEKLPVNAMGKRVEKLLQAAWECGQSAGNANPSPVFYPIVLKEELSDSILNLTILIPENLFYFKGHFPGMPIVPGVVQLHWAVQFARKHFKISGAVSQGNRIKFSRLMRGGDQINLSLQYLPEKQMVAYSYKTDEHVYASGSFILSCDKR